MATKLSCQKHTISTYTGKHLKYTPSEEERLKFQGTNGKGNCLQNCVWGKRGVGKKNTNLSSHGAREVCSYLPFNHIK